MPSDSWTSYSPVLDPEGTPRSTAYGTASAQEESDDCPGSHDGGLLTRAVQGHNGRVCGEVWSGYAASFSFLVNSFF